MRKFLSYISLFIFILIGVTSFQNCGTPFESSLSSTNLNSTSLDLNTYDDLYEKIISPKCLSCHNKVLASGNIDLSSFEAMMSSDVVLPGDAGSSRFYLAVDAGSMPPNQPLLKIEINAIGDWINDGAKGSNGVASNEVPFVEAGAYNTFVLPIESITITGQASDPDGAIAEIKWTQLTGPNSATLSGDNTLVLSISNLVKGTYTFLLEVSDDEGAKSSDTVSIMIVEADNKAPSVNAGSDQSILEPAINVNLFGTASDSDGMITSIVWSLTSGPMLVTIENPNSLATKVSMLSQIGTYEFKLTVTDNKGASNSDSVKIIVNSAGNMLPVADAGNDRSITLPTNSIVINGSGVDSDGTISGYVWTQISGPSAATLNGKSTATLTASALVEGEYIFELKVRDNKEGVGTDQVIVTVHPEPTGPSFSEINQLIFGPKCLSCHSGSNPKGGYGMASYNQVMENVTPKNLNLSLLYTKVQDNSMPKGNDGPLSSAEKNMIQQWILNGAPNN